MVARGGKVRTFQLVSALQRTGITRLTMSLATSTSHIVNTLLLITYITECYNQTLKSYSLLYCYTKMNINVFLVYLV